MRAVGMDIALSMERVVEGGSGIGMLDALDGLDAMAASVKMQLTCHQSLSHAHYASWLPPSCLSESSPPPHTLLPLSRTPQAPLASTTLSSMVPGASPPRSLPGAASGSVLSMYVARLFSPTSSAHSISVGGDPRQSQAQPAA